MRFDDDTVRLDHLGKTVDRLDLAFDLDALTFGCHPRVGVGLEPAFGLGETTFVELLALVQPGAADLEIFTARCEMGRTSLELGP